MPIIAAIVSRIAAFLPGSPAEVGPLSGHGYSYVRGQNLMKDFMRGIQMEVPELKRTTMDATSNVVFGANSIQMAIHGPMDEKSARKVGASMGNSAADLIARRDTRLAVRTL